MVDEFTAEQLRLLFRAASQKGLKVFKGTASTDRWVSSAKQASKAEALGLTRLHQLMYDSLCWPCWVKSEFPAHLFASQTGLHDICHEHSS